MKKFMLILPMIFYFGCGNSRLVQSIDISGRQTVDIKCADGSKPKAASYPYGANEFIIYCPASIR